MSLNFKKLNNQQGFSLLEVIIATFVITIGIVAVVNLVGSAIGSVAISESQVIATNLCQEGLEVVRNIRDSNWDAGELWNNGLSSGDHRIEYNSNNLLSLSGNLALKLDSNGYYQYSSGNDTLFHRKITVNNINDHEIDVISEVSWSQRGKSFDVSAKIKLYDWR